MKQYFIRPVLRLALVLLVLNITADCAFCCKQAVDSSEQLLPLSHYGQAVEICMRVLSDPTHEYDQETATDLCVGRLVRLSDTVVQMEHRHRTQKPYPAEDIAYIMGLMGIVQKDRKQDLSSSHTALSVTQAIESRLALLLANP